MSCTDLTSCLALLLSDATLRQDFLRDRAAWLAQFTLADNERKFIYQLSERELLSQSQLLITKRMRETAQLIPATLKLLGSGYAPLFRAYAAQNWPSHHRRHVLDAWQFCCYLNARGRAVVKPEFNRLAIQLGRKRAGLQLVRGYRLRRELRVLLYWRQRLHEWTLYFAL